MTTLTCSLAAMIRQAPQNVRHRSDDEVSPALREAIMATQQRIDTTTIPAGKFRATLKASHN